MKKYLLAAIAAVAVVAPAQAVVTSVAFASNSTAVPSYITSQMLENFEKNPNTYKHDIQGTAGVKTGSVPGITLAPTGSQYMSISNGSYTMNFGGGVQVLSFVLGSLDAYNSIQLTFSDKTVQTLTGRQIITGLASDFPKSGSTNFGDAGRVTYDQGGLASIMSAKFISTTAAFEFDDVVTSAPEPAAWAMMIVGFGLAGTQLRSRRRNDKLATA